MKPINANTKIAHLLKAHPEAMETIIGISKKFDKLRNPLLRKLLAGRTSIAMASSIAGCQVTDFFDALRPLGFEIDTDVAPITEAKKELPSFITKLGKHQIIDFDVRDLLADGKDPLSLIINKTKALETGQALKIINTFEPTPLIKMLEKQGFEVYVDRIDNDLIETYFHKKSEETTIQVTSTQGADSGWEAMLQQFNDKLVTIDVRQLEMPQPMMRILEQLDVLPSDSALFVYHKRIPVFLLPELAERNFDYRIKEIAEGEVRLLIYKK